MATVHPHEILAALSGAGVEFIVVGQRKGAFASASNCSNLEAALAAFRWLSMS